MTTENPTNPTDAEYEDIDQPNSDINAEKEAFLREFFSRQRELQRKSLAAVADLAGANIELILRSGLGEVAAKRTATAMVGGGHAVVGDIVKQRVDTNELIIDRITRAIQTNVE